MTAITDSVVTLANDSAIAGGHSPPARRTRARTRVPVTARSLQFRAAARRQVRSWVRVVYLDAADSWIVSERSPSIREVWNADYTVPGDYAPFRTWCRVYRYPAVVAAVVLDGIKWTLVHPVRGPLAIAATTAGAAAVGVAVIN